MKGLAKETLTSGILKWLPRGHLVLKSTSQNNENKIVVGWMNGTGTTSVTEVTFDNNIVDRIQQTIEADDENRLGSYMEIIEEHVMLLAAQHDNGDSQPWHLNEEILADVLTTIQ